jgi:protein TonB
MEASKIMQADILDILFEGKNKDYGAYELRKTYNGRLLKAISGMVIVIGLLLPGYYISNANGGSKRQLAAVQDVDLESVKAKADPPPVIPPPVKIPPKIQTIRFTPPKVVKDIDVKPDEKPPEQDKLEDTKIGAVNQEGIKDEGITGPPVDAGRGVVEGPKKDETDYDGTFTEVEVESSYPTGMAGWARYLHKSLQYPDDAVNREIQGVVVVRFIVDKDGNVSDVEAISGPEQGGVREEAIRVIKKSGKWTPAIQNGRQVKSYKSQPIVFKLGDGQ